MIPNRLSDPLRQRGKPLVQKTGGYRTEQAGERGGIACLAERVYTLLDQLAAIPSELRQTFRERVPQQNRGRKIVVGCDGAKTPIIEALPCRAGLCARIFPAMYQARKICRELPGLAPLLLALNRRGLRTDP